MLLTEALTYPGIRTLAHTLHLRTQGIALDEHGIVPDALEEACKRGVGRVLYVLPTLQNPTSVVMPLERRRRIAEIARAYGLVIVEDDTTGFACADAPPPIASLAPELTYFVTSLSKSLYEGLRIGYLPQDIELFDGTVSENISRLDPQASSDAVIAAAKLAGIHDIIVHLAEGYQTRIGEGGMKLSAGQRQRVALARALYGDPFLVVLDEPNSNLDTQGDLALTSAIRSVRDRGGIVIVVAHRPSALAGLDKVLALSHGQVQAFGPRDEVLKSVLQSVPAAAVPLPAAATSVSAAPPSMRALPPGLKMIADGVAAG